MAPPRFVARSLARLAVGGAAAAAIAWVVGWTAERARFGPDAAASTARLEAEVSAQFADLSIRLDRTVRSVSAEASTVRSAEQGDTGASRLLFARVAAGAGAAGLADVAVTLYGQTAEPVAWTGRTTDLPAARVSGPPSLFLAPGTQGLQLIRVEPLVDPSEPGRRAGAIVAEAPISHEASEQGADAGFPLATSIVPVSVRPRFEGGAAAGPGTFLVRSPNGDALGVVRVSSEKLFEARRTVTARRWAAALTVLALTLLLMAGPVLDWRLVTSSASTSAGLTSAVAALLLLARAVLWVAVRLVDVAGPSLTATGSWSPLLAMLLASPIDFTLSGLLLVALVALAASTFRLWRAGRYPGVRGIAIEAPWGRALFVLAHLAAGMAVATALAAYAGFLRTHISDAPVDILRFSVDPRDGMRLLVVLGLVALNAAVVGACVLVLRMAADLSIVSGVGRAWRGGPEWLWVMPGALLVGFGLVESRPPGMPTLVAVAFTAAAAWAAGRCRAALRQTTQAVRLIVWFLVLATPSLVIYPMLVAAADGARRQLVETRYAPEVINQRRDVRIRLTESLAQIDRIEALGDLVRASDPLPAGPPPSDAAFLIWSQTGLAGQRLTSSVELYNAAGALVSRFALKLPDSPQAWTESSCDWALFEEVSPFYSEERRLLHAGRQVCVRGAGGALHAVGSIVVNVTLDYSNLSFISAQSPYVALMRSGRPRPEPRPRTDVEFTVYGWSRSVLYTSGQTAPPLPDPLFKQAFASRAPFWATVDRGSTSLDAYVLNDRGGLYVLAIGRQTPVGHLVTLAELITLVFLVFVVGVGASVLFSVLASRLPLSGRALLHEVRASFYRKLFLAFVAAAIVPVLAMALVSRAYIASLMFADIQSEATRTATMASRVVEDFARAQTRGLASPPDDNIVVWLSRVIAQDVNIYDGAHLLASSERNLFASGLIPTRTSGDAYRAILLEGRPSSVGRDRAGGLDYLVAAAPVRVQERNAVLTVPLTSRQQETEAQINELDRRVLLAALVFIMVGAGMGYSMAERIADPVNRLMRATRRIARGDLDARVLATSSDELRRLVDAFNGMAADLQRQRRELERTNRLAAWADMARQVAHDIKNPLTPIQLNAEHLRRVHLDSGHPLGTVVDDCVANILGQVRLLRQIASEFSSFASTPTPRIAETSLAEMFAEVVDPYRPGLAGRVTIETIVASGLPLVRVDRVLVGRALTNIIENALHAMPGGGSLRISAEREGEGRVSVRVVDTGPGMDAEALARIFEPYFSTKAIGTGLGLTIAKRNVEASGGTIAVHSAPGAGTTVTLTLPTA